MNCDLRHVNVVLCCDPKAFTHTNPLDGMAEGGCLVWESDEEARAGLGAHPAVGPPADPRQEDPRLHPARASTSRARRPTAPTCSCACRATPSSARSSASRRSSRSSGSTRSSSARSCTSSTRRSSAGSATPSCASNMEVMVAGLLARAGDRRSATLDARRPLHACAAQALLPVRAATAAAAAAGAGRIADARRPGRAGAGLRSIATFDRSSAPASATTSRPRPLASVGVMAAGTRRHGVEVRRAPRDAGLHRRELHAVHGVHRGLPGHGAAELLRRTSTRSCATAVANYVTDAGRARRSCSRALPEIEKRTRERMRERGRRRREDAAAADLVRAGHRRGRRLLGRGQERALRHHRQAAAGLPEGERHLRDAGEEDARRAAASSRSSSPTSARAARRASPRAATTRRCGWCRRPRTSTPSTRPARRSSNLLPDTPQKYLGLYNDAQPAGLARRRRSATT